MSVFNDRECRLSVIAHTLREFVLNNSNHPNHVVLTARLQAHLRWRNANARAPELLAAQRRERARVRAEKGHRWGRPAPRAA